MIGGRAVIDDAYNANPASMRASLALLAERMPPRVAVLGEMRELGADADALHEAVGRVAQRAADTVVAVGQAARPIARGAGPGALHFDEVDAAAAWLGEHVPVGATVLLKASRGAALERIVPLLASSWEAN
jgi:UDP-N-acetylmuramoyl-tripeptide--D-alanyl-D-alanine ligase